MVELIIVRCGMKKGQFGHSKRYIKEDRCLITKKALFSKRSDLEEADLLARQLSIHELLDNQLLQSSDGEGLLGSSLAIS